MRDPRLRPVNAGWLRDQTVAFSNSAANHINLAGSDEAPLVCLRVKVGCGSCRSMQVANASEQYNGKPS